MITVVGLGFVGLTTALGFCQHGIKVFGLEKDAQRATTLQEGQVPFFEPFLDQALQDHLGDNFIITDDWLLALHNSSAVFLCVGTPCDQQGRADLSHLIAALEEALDQRDPQRFLALVIKSTVPPGTVEKKVRSIIEQRGLILGERVGLASNPEFLREGAAWNDFIRPDRVVIGTNEDETSELLCRLYEPFGAPIHVTSPSTAEFIKYLSNCLLATMISFSNEMGMLADAVGGIDIPKAFGILHQDRRWQGTPAGMASYVYPGCGFGGYCLPKDVAAMSSVARQMGRPAAILESVLEINQAIKGFWVDKVAVAMTPQSRIALLGLSFKPGSDDVRDTPSAEVIRLLQGKGYNNLVAYDPMANQAFRQAYDFDLEIASSLHDALRDCQAVVILTAWPEFVEKQAMFRDKLVLDFRHCLASLDTEQRSV